MSIRVRVLGMRALNSNYRTECHNDFLSQSGHKVDLVNQSEYGVSKEPGPDLLVFIIFWTLWGSILVSIAIGIRDQ